MQAVKRAITVAVGLASAGAHAVEPTPTLQPTSKWQVDYALAECRLLRTFGDGDRRVTLQLTRLGVDDALELSLAGPSIPATYTDLPAKVATSTVGAIGGMYGHGYPAEEGAPAMLRFHANTALAAALRSDTAAGKPTTLHIGFTRRFDADVDLGTMAAPLAALDRCTDDLVREWGLDPAEQHQRKVPPLPVDNARDWLQSADYPNDLIRSASGGAVIVHLIGGVDGSVTSCGVSKAAGTKAFEELTCRLLIQRAHFHPATNAAGQPIRSLWIQRVDWRPGYLVG